MTPEEGPLLPRQVTWLVGVMVLGGVLSMASTVLSLAGMDALLTDLQVQLSQAGGETFTIPEVFLNVAVVFTVVLGLLATLLWFLFAWLFHRGSSRVLGTVLGGLNLFGSLGAPLSLATGPNRLIGLTDTVLLFTIIAGLVLLWLPQTSAYFRWRRALASVA